MGISLRIVGISPSPHPNAQLAEVANQVVQMLEIDPIFSAEEFGSYGEYAGEACGAVTPACREAVILAARTEGLLLDPVYTDKRLAHSLITLGKGSLPEIRR